MKNKKNMVKIICIVFICFAFVGCTIIALELYSETFVTVVGSRFGTVEGFWDGEFYQYITWNDIDHDKYYREEVRFRSGENRLQGFVYGGINNNGLIVISEGLGATADTYIPMIMYFVDNGWRVFAFNNTGVSWSEGNSIFGLNQSVIDLDAALTYIENVNSFKGLPVMLVGHSWGGYAVCTVLNYSHHVNAVVSFAGFNNGNDVLKERGESIVGGAFFLFSPQLSAIEKQLFGDVAKLTAIEGINKVRIPVMIVQCSDDDVIPADTTSIYAHRNEISNSNVEIIYRDDEDAMGHYYIFCSKEQKEYMAWADKNWQTYSAEYTNASKIQWAEEINFDKTLAYELDHDLMERINVMFNNAK